MGHILGKDCLFGSPYVIFVLCLFVILVISHFGFEGGTLVLIAPLHCLLYLFLFTILRNEKRKKGNTAVKCHSFMKITKVNNIFLICNRTTFTTSNRGQQSNHGGEHGGNLSVK